MRTKTAALHRELDEQVGEFSTVDQYATYLQGMLRFRDGMEASLAASGLLAEFPEFTPVMIAGELRADALALQRPGAPHATLAEDAAPAIGTRDELLGTLYVLEGSTLGARVLARRAAKLGLDEHSGAAHLKKQSSELGNWNAFAALLETAKDVDEEAMANAALRTFGYAVRAFETD